MDKSQNEACWKKMTIMNGVEKMEEEEEKQRKSGAMMMMVEPQTPNESMEFLSRSWSVSAEEIAKALASSNTHNNHFHFHNNNQPPPTSPSLPLPPTSPPLLVEKMMSSGHSRRMGGIGKWFHHHHYHHKDSNHGSVKRKDRARAENAHMHATLSIAGLASALAALAANTNNNIIINNSTNSTSKMSRAVASATELLASHCIEIAEQAGADQDRVSSAIRSAVDIRTPGDLMTLTAAAATALRAESALKARLPKDAKKTASIIPYDKGLGETHSLDSFPSDTEEQQKFPCVGELLQHTGKGGLRWKRVSVYINKKSEVMVKLKRKHVAGAFSKKDKCLVYEVCDQISEWPFRNERENVDAYFGLKTGQGFLEFKCKSKVHKQQWVDGIQSMLHQVGSVGDIEHSLKRLCVK